MPLGSIYAFVEGLDDKRFFKKVVEPRLNRKFPERIIHLVMWTQTKNKAIEEKFLNCAKLDGGLVLYFVDFDSGPCIRGRKTEEVGKQSGLREEDVIVVVPEIESWYVAGLNAKAMEQFKFQSLDDVNDLSKSRFKRLVAKSIFDDEDWAMQEILEVYDIDTARKTNHSFDWFMGKFF